MTIPEMWYEIKRVLSGDMYLVLLIIFVGLSAFGLGRLSALEERRVPVQIEYVNDSVGAAAPAVSEDNDISVTAEGKYVASKNSDKYHFPWCSGAARIAEGNKIWFASRSEAEQAGYTPAANCKGL